MPGPVRLLLCPVVNLIFIVILQGLSPLLFLPVQKLSLREVQQPASGHTASQRPSWYLPPPVSDGKPHYFHGLGPQPCQVLPLPQCTLTSTLQAFRRGAELGLGGVGLVHMPPPSVWQDLNSVPCLPEFGAQEAVSMATPPLPAQGCRSQF